MPLPEVGNKDKDTYMQECVSMLVSEGQPQDQAAAACMAHYENSTSQFEPGKKPKSKIEIMADIKKMFDKNGFTINDESILELFGAAQQVCNKLEIHKLEKQNGYEIKVFPKKKIYIQHENTYIDFNDILFDQMIESFNNSKLFKPFVDEQHKLGEKFGDVTELYKKDDGLYAKIKLNEYGETLIKKNVYSYVSPEWGDRMDTEKKLHKNVLWAITLTNIPALEGENPKLQDQIKLYKGGNMNIALAKEKLAKFEGSLSHKLQDDPVIPGLDEIVAMVKELLMKLEEVTGQKEIAEDQAEGLQGKLNAIETAKTSAEKEAFFEKSVSLGKIDPKELEDWRHQYDVSKDFVIKMISMRPEKSSKQLTATVPDNSKLELGKDDYHVMEQMGYKKQDGSYDVDRYAKEVLKGLN